MGVLSNVQLRVWGFCPRGFCHGVFVLGGFVCTPVFICLQFKSFEDTLGKGEIASSEQFLLFRQCFLPVCRIFYHFHQIQNCSLQTLSVSKSIKFVIWERVKIPIPSSQQYAFQYAKCKEFQFRPV